METNQIEWRSAESATTEGPSVDFIRAVAELLETNPNDILAELGYTQSDDLDTAVNER
jgi:hypothetical protein